MNLAHVHFHGFRVPLLGIGEDETLQECAACGKCFDLLQVRLADDGQFRCDECTAKNNRGSE